MLLAIESKQMTISISANDIPASVRFMATSLWLVT